MTEKLRIGRHIPDSACHVTNTMDSKSGLLRKLKNLVSSSKETNKKTRRAETKASMDERHGSAASHKLCLRKTFQRQPGSVQQQRTRDKHAATLAQIANSVKVKTPVIHHMAEAIETHRSERESDIQAAQASAKEVTGISRHEETLEGQKCIPSLAVGVYVPSGLNASFHETSGKHQMDTQTKEQAQARATFILPDGVIPLMQEPIAPAQDSSVAEPEPIVPKRQEEWDSGVKGEEVSEPASAKAKPYNPSASSVDVRRESEELGDEQSDGNPGDDAHLGGEPCNDWDSYWLPDALFNGEDEGDYTGEPARVVMVTDGGQDVPAILLSFDLSRKIQEALRSGKHADESGLVAEDSLKALFDKEKLLAEKIHDLQTRIKASEDISRADPFSPTPAGMLIGRLQLKEELAKAQHRKGKIIAERGTIVEELESAHSQRRETQSAVDKILYPIFENSRLLLTQTKDAQSVLEANAASDDESHPDNEWKTKEVFRRLCRV